MRELSRIIIHCSATPPSMDIGVSKIREWHKARGWSDIGYHFVIRRDGRVQKGRALSRVGAHTKGHNGDSIGICLVGGVNEKGKPQANYTAEQWAELEELVAFLQNEHKIEVVHGHNRYAAKACPCFDVVAWHGGGDTMIPAKDKADKDGF